MINRTPRRPDAPHPSRVPLLIALLGGLVIGLAVSNGRLVSDVDAAANQDYEELETFTNVMSIVQKNYVEEVPTKKLVEGAINGHSVTFLVDTGASVVSVNEELAGKIGLSAGSPTIFNTANGRALGRIVPEASVRVGGIRVDGIRVGIGNSERALLGQNFLKKVQLTQGADRMVLRAISSP